MNPGYTLADYPFHAFDWLRIATLLGAKLFRLVKQDRCTVEALFVLPGREELLSVYDNGGEANLYARPRVLKHPVAPFEEYTQIEDASVPYTQWGCCISEETFAYRLQCALGGNAIDYSVNIRG